jgi:uncharacterized protein
VAEIERYRLPGDMPETLPLFPLRGAILLPRSELPLNIFEPRYLEMINDALRSTRLVGIIQPDNISQGVESPAGKVAGLKRIGCAGRITRFQEMADGRIEIGLTGVARFVVTEELSTTRPYRIAAAEFSSYAVDFAEDESVNRLDREHLLGVLKAFLTARKLDADWNMIAKAPLERLVNGLSIMSPFNPEEKQALLEASDIKHRADVLIALAEMAIASSHDTGGGRLQ